MKLLLILAALTTPVTVGDDVFGPTKLTVAKGAKVKFKWTGENPHNVVVAKGPVTFRSRTQRSGTYTRKFKQPGTYTLVCTIHTPDMQMTVRVKR